MRRHALMARIVVVGAGPAGCATALHLCRAGHEVVLVDRRSFPRPKACGEGLLPAGVTELARLGLPGVGEDAMRIESTFNRLM